MGCASGAVNQIEMKRDVGGGRGDEVRQTDESLYLLHCLVQGMQQE